jgi:arabinofuranan 3-O-arabinosyltransferase
LRGFGRGQRVTVRPRRLAVVKSPPPLDARDRNLATWTALRCQVSVPLEADRNSWMSKGDRFVVPPGPKKLWLYGAAAIGVWLFSLFFQITNGAWLIDSFGRPAFSNFLCIWATGRMALNGQAAASYDWNSLRKAELVIVGTAAPDQFILPWFYPPTFLLATACLGLLPYIWSCVAWLVVTGLGYVAAIRAILPYRLAVVLALAAPSTLLNIILMETGFAVAALAAVALLLLETQPILAGAALGVLTFKPQLGLLFPLVLMVTGRWRAFFSAAATTFLLAGLAALVFGPDVWRAYLQVWPTIGTIALGGHVDWSDVQTWYSVARFLGAGAALAWTVYAVSAGVCAAAICSLWCRPVSYNLKAAALATGSFLVTPYVMSHDTVLLVVAVAFLVRESIATGFRRGDVEIYVLALCAPFYPVFINDIVPVLPFVYSGLLAWIILRARVMGATLNPGAGLAAPSL